VANALAELLGADVGRLPLSPEEVTSLIRTMRS
jgi:CO/xanthine dehydrogenase Mo-binding subunit